MGIRLVRKGKIIRPKAVQIGILVAALCVFSYPAAAITLEFPGPATPTANPEVSRASYALPTGRWTKDGLPSDVIYGTVEHAAWHVDVPKLSSLDLMQPLRAQLVEAGFKPVFECETESCGGFDFRFALDVLPEPEMHVDLGDFRYLSARKGTEAIGLLVSRSSIKGFVQLTRARTDTGPKPFAATHKMGDSPAALGESLTLSTSNQMPPSSTPAAAQFLTGGAVVLEGLDFGTGTTDLTEGKYESLAALADWLAENPERGVTLVGHTDASGGLDGNIVISKRRAASVRARLIDVYDIPASQLLAQGVGYLAPIASNLTDEGRQKNRRVEAILTATE